MFKSKNSANENRLLKHRNIQLLTKFFPIRARRIRLRFLSLTRAGVKKAAVIAQP